MRDSPLRSAMGVGCFGRDDGVFGTALGKMKTDDGRFVFGVGAGRATIRQRFFRLIRYGLIEDSAGRFRR